MTWRERIVAARSGGFTERDREDARTWATCAVGEQHAKMPETVIYVTIPGCSEPADYYLEGFGLDFMDAVRENDPASAESLLDAIEDRVLTLKREAHGVSA